MSSPAMVAASRTPALLSARSSAPPVRKTQLRAPPMAALIPAMQVPGPARSQGSFALRQRVGHSQAKRAETLLVRSSAAAAVPAGEPVLPESAGGIGELAASANVAKSILGAGCFALPWAFAQSGTVFTTAYMAVAAALCVYCIALMQRAREVACAGKPELAATTTSYSGLATATIGSAGGRLTEATVLVCCFGICSAFMVFVAATMATILQPPIMAQAITQNTLVWYVTPLLVGLAWIRNMAGVSLISMLGNVSVLTGMTAVAYYALQLPPQFAAIPLVKFGGFAKAFGSVAFLFFVHFTLPPIESSMAKPQRFLSAATSGFVFSLVVSALFGIVGALYFGPNVNSVVIAMLQGQGIVVGVKLLLCLNLLCTFPVVVSAAFQILEGLIKQSTGKPVSDPVVYILRTIFVILAAAVAVGIPSFGKLLGLVGGVSCTMLTMIFPPLMLLAASRRVGKAINPVEKVLMYLIIAAGLVISYMSIIG